MTLRYIANARFPTEKAYGVQVAKTCEALGQAQADVELIVPARRNPELENEEPFNFYQVKRSFHIVWLKSLDPVWLLKLPAGPYIKTQTLLFIRQLKKYLRDNLKPTDIIYTRDEYLLPFLFSPYQGEKQRGADKILCEVHNVPRRAKYYAQYWNKCHKVIAISQGVKKDLIKAGVKSNKITILPDAVDVEMFDINISTKKAREKVGLPQDKKIILTNSSLYKWKGADTLLQTAENVKCQMSNVKCLFVFVGGPDNQVERLKQKTKQMDLNNILILGHQPYKLIPYYLKAADVLILPATTQPDQRTNFKVKYTSPLKAFEFLASGRPIVAANLPAIREILDDSNATFYKPDDPQDLAAKIEIAAKTNKATLAANRKKANNYSWTSRAQKILEIIS